MKYNNNNNINCIGRNVYFIFSRFKQTAEYDYIGYKTTNNNNNKKVETNTFILYVIVKF